MNHYSVDKNVSVGGQFIRWIVTYPLDKVILILKNWGLIIVFIRTLKKSMP